VRRLIGVLSILLTLGIAAHASETLTREQADALVKAAWKDPPKSIDITYWITVGDYTKTEAELRRLYESLFDMEGTDGEPGKVTRERRDQFVQMNVESVLKERQEGGRTEKVRARFDGKHQRIEEFNAKKPTTQETVPQKSIRNDPCDSELCDTCIIETTDANGVSERYVYSHQGRGASRQIVPHWSSYEDSEVMKFTQTPAATLLRGYLGTPERGSGTRARTYSPDPNKYEQLCAGTLSGVRVRIQPDKEAPDERERIDLIMTADQGRALPWSTMVCAKGDYSKVYRYEVRFSEAGPLMMAMSRRDFDAQGFPHGVTIVEYDGRGNIRLQKEYRIEKVSLNTPIPDAVFQFAPPKGYMVTDARLPPDKQEAARIAQLKEWLTHEKPADRLQAISILFKELYDRPEELRAIATAMKDDESPTVRGVAAFMLQDLEKRK
jgi:hypothetical protein